MAKSCFPEVSTQKRGKKSIVLLIEKRAAPTLCDFQRVGNLDCRYGEVWGICQLHMFGAVVTHPCKERKDGAASVRVARSVGHPSACGRVKNS